LRTTCGDNQPNTRPNWAIDLRDHFSFNLNLGRKTEGFEGQLLLRNLKEGETTLSDAFMESSFVRSRSVVARVIAGETLIVPVRSKVGDLASIYSFNGTGSLIWQLLDSPKTVAELATAVAREYDVDVVRAERDVTEFVGEMKGVGLVEVSASLAMAGD
jgi:hypothetical protein